MPPMDTGDLLRLVTIPIAGMARSYPRPRRGREEGAIPPIREARRPQAGTTPQP